jgi:hypothetical protein
MICDRKKIKTGTIKNPRDLVFCNNNNNNEIPCFFFLKK